MSPPRAAAALLALSALLACVSAEQGVRQQPDPTSGHYVRSIALSNTRGEVGKPFRSALSFDSNYLTPDQAEYAVTGLPPGLAFDPRKRTVEGVPRRAGFFTVRLAVRKQVDRSGTHRPSPDEGWWPVETEMSIYAPIR